MPHMGDTQFGKAGCRMHAEGEGAVGRAVLTTEIAVVHGSDAEVRFGSRLCKNADIETNCATIESGR